MLQRRAWLWTVAVTVALMIAITAPMVADAASIAKRIDRAVRTSGLRGVTDIVVFDVEDQMVIYRNRPDVGVAPASNAKLVTTAAALQRFGPNYRFTTRVAFRGTQHGSRFDGNVYLIGGGDPTLSTKAFARRNLSGHAGNLDLLWLPFRLRGITKVRGRLIVDDSAFDQRRWVRQWPARYRLTQSGPLGALTVNLGHVGATLDSPAAHDPALHAGARYRALLTRHGISVSGGTLHRRTPANAKTVGSIDSPPLRQILAFMDQTSDNFTAEILLKDLGRMAGGRGTTAGGARVARRQLKALEIPVDGIRIVDGSGLAGSNRATARRMAELINALDDNSILGPSFRAALAVSGRSGTLRGRLASRAYRGRVRGKTGTLNNASALSGFATRRNGQRYGFSVMTWTGSRSAPISTAHTLQDRIAAILVQ